MAKMTLLEMTQDILNDMDSDSVNSIEDTIESQQVAQIIKTTYNDIISNRNWPHLRKLIQLDALNDLDKPTYLKLPNETKELIFFKYEKQKEGDPRNVSQEVRWKEPDAFLRMVSGRDSTNDNVTTIVDFSGTRILVNNNMAPQYWTSFDDLHVVCDSYDSSVDDTLKQEKTQALAYMDPVWVHTNDAIPDLPSEAFSALLEDSKRTAMFKLKQMSDVIANERTIKQQRWLSRKAWRAEGGVKFADFGRKGRR